MEGWKEGRIEEGWVEGGRQDGGVEGWKGDKRDGRKVVQFTSQPERPPYKSDHINAASQATKHMFSLP